MSDKAVTQEGTEKALRLEQKDDKQVNRANTASKI